MNNARRATAHTFLALLEAMLIASLLVVLVAGTAFAGKGGSTKPPRGGSTGGSGTLSVVMSVDANGSGTPNWADAVTYQLSTTATTKPYVSTSCSVGRTQVLSASAGYFDAYPWPSAQVVILKTDRWTGGGASCVARLYSMDSGSQVILTTINFAVGA